MSEPRRLLVVDDDVYQARGIQLVLADYDVTVESVGRNAVARLVRGERFDAIVYDVMVPDCSGIEFQRCVTALGGRAPVLFVTGNPYTPEFVAFLAARPWMEKPVDEGALRARIDALIGAA